MVRLLSNFNARNSVVLTYQAVPESVKDRPHLIAAVFQDYFKILNHYNDLNPDLMN